MTTICTACRWYRNTKAARRGGPPASMWYYKLCTHPDVERPTTIDPVSGDVKYMSKNDLGRTILHDAPHPFCRDINDGECGMFEAKVDPPEERREQATTMTTIYKYPFAIADRVTLRMPIGAKILHVAPQGGTPCLWAHVDPSRPTVNWLFRIYGTGHPIDGEGGGEGTHVATFLMGPFVWHAFLMGVVAESTGGPPP